MPLEVIFQFSIYALSALAAGTFALIDPWPIAGASIVVAIVAFILNEQLKIATLPAFWSGLLGIAAFALTGVEHLFGTAETPVLAGGHLLIYLSCIAYFQPQTPRKYWMLCALAVGELTIAGIFATSGYFGLLSIGFLSLGVWTLAVFSLYRAEQHFVQSNAAIDLGAGLAGSTDRRDSSAQALARSLRLHEPSRLSGSILREPGEQWINSRFVMGTLVMTMASLLISTVFFLFIPRVWTKRESLNPDAPLHAVQALAGFSGRVQLGDLGMILSSNERVFEIDLYDNDTGERLNVERYARSFGYDEPLFRGSVLAEYRRGGWHAGLKSASTGGIRVPRSKSLVRQEYVLEPLGTEMLFAMHPLLGCRFPDSNDLPQLERDRSELLRPDGETLKTTSFYQVFSPETASSSNLIGGLPVIESGFIHRFHNGRWFRRRYLDQSDQGLERLNELAEQVVASPGGETSKLQQALKLRDYLGSNPEFEYSLDASINDPTIDPVEDFLFNRKSGHCEYYASAFALMLRAIGIPSRVVTGFKGGSVNSFSGTFVVEQRHAHSWVEALINDRWVVLDPTPGESRSASVQEMGRRFSSWSDFMALISDAWSRYVVGLNLERQRQEFFQPIGETATTVVEVARGNESASRILQGIVSFLTSPRQWFTLFGLLVFASIVGIALLTIFIWRKTAGWRAKLLKRLRSKQGKDRVRIDFYEEFKRVCAAHGLVRDPAQTQQEFAAEAFRKLRQPLTQAGLSDLPADVTDSFYRVRFGSQPLDERSTASMRAQIKSFETALAGNDKASRT